ncbi:heme ABC transporter ATP-binding protein [Paenibacillus sp.]|uniref:heme ABC transporter ATP-binding protein n=1 Tax=Paenibacillus sp. TaxID=58172 RepID=UPI002D2FEBF7|nr:heme ABC transporter ATP-binding protein [Paenibacillus sp.]HZG55216.1 heme ABC transporter ATP-binding protein [Paenibacillus sp.]
MIRASGVEKSYQGEAVLRGVGLEVRAGEAFGIIGPNGSGKTTLLKLLSGLETADAGEIVLDGRPVGSYKRKELARWLAVLQQDALPPVGFTVREVVEMGRYPFQNWLGEEPGGEAGRIDSVLDCMGLTAFADRPVERLSGGERQRVALAKAMAQRPRVLLLDEPTTYLDIGYQMQLMNLIREWQQGSSLTVVAVLHDLNLAAMYCDRLLLLDGGRPVCVGTPREVLTPARIQDVYGAQATVVRHPTTGAPQMLLEPGAAATTSGKPSSII